MTLNRAFAPPQAESDTFVSKTPIKGVVYVEITLAKQVLELRLLALHDEDD